jgi:phage protein U
MAQTGSFGEFIFEVSSEKVKTWRDLRRRRKAKYSSHDVTDAKQRLQFHGLELDTAELSVNLDSWFLDPRAEIRQLDGILESGEAYPLILGDIVEGNFVLEEYSEERKHTDGQGRIRWTEVSLRLREHN